jgi:hypothetical protein
VIALLPQLLVQPAEEEDGLGIPAPPEVEREVAEALDGIRKFGNNGEGENWLQREILLDRLLKVRWPKTLPLCGSTPNIENRRG